MKYDEEKTCEEACPAAGARGKWKLLEHDCPTPVSNLSGTLQNVGATPGPSQMGRPLVPGWSLKAVRASPGPSLGTLV